MNEELIKILELDAKASEKDIVTAVKALKAKADAASTKAGAEKEISDLITKSGGALNRESASMVLRDRKSHAAKSTAKK
jgi:hypothetical protein